MLCDAAGPEGRVVAVDIDTRFLGPAAGRDIVQRAIGMDGTWARHPPQRLGALGRRDIRAEITTSLFRGGSPEAELYRMSWIQVRDWLLGGGMADSSSQPQAPLTRRSTPCQ